MSHTEQIMAKIKQEWPNDGNSIAQNEHQFREMIDALPAAIYITDAEGRLTYFNPAAVEFSGRRPKLGTDHWCVTWKLFHPDGTPMPHDTCPMAVALKEGRSINGAEAIAERPDGERIWFEAYPSPLRDDEGKVIGGINMLVDITDRKKAEGQIRRSERELSDFFDNATLGLHWVGPDGIILRANQAELDMLGYTHEEYIGHHIADFHADEEVIEDILRRLKAGEELHDYEARMRCKDGSIRQVLISSNVFRENGEFVHTRCFTRDVTERKQAEQALQENKRQLASQVDDMKRLHALSTQLLSQNNVEDTLHEVMEASAKLLHADKASVQIYDENDDVLRLVSAIGFDKDFLDQFQTIHTDGFTTCAASLRQREQVLVEDLSSDPDFAAFNQAAAPYDVSAALSTPLYGSDGQFFGVFTMYWDNPHRPAEDKLQLLDLYTQQAARQVERKKAEEALQRSEKWFRQLLEKLPAAAYTCDSEGMITYYNQQAAEVWGREPKLNSSTERFCGSVQLYLPDGSPVDHSDCWMALALKHDEEYNGKEIIIEQENGRRVTGLANISPIHDESGKLIGAVNIVTDIGRLKQMEEALRESEAQLKADLGDSKLLQSISSQLIKEENVEVLYEKILDASAAIMHSECASMQMFHPDRGSKGELQLLTSRGFNQQAVKFWEWVGPASASVCGMALRNSKRVIVPDVEQCEAIAGTEDLKVFRQTGIRAVQTTPLISRSGQILGMISTHWSEPHQPSERNLRMLDILARQAADLIEQKQAEQALRESERKYRTLFESMDEGFCIIEVLFDDNDKPVDYRYLEVNSAFEEQTGQKDVEGKRARELHSDHEEYWFEEYGKVVTTGEPIRFEKPARSLNRFFSVYAFPFGQPGSGKIAVLFNNITDRKQSERTSALLSAIIDGSDDAIISKNLDSIITSWNKSAERMFGYTAEEAIGQPITILIPPDRIDEETSIIARLRRGERIDHFETIRHRKDGTSLNVSLTISPIQDSTGKIVGASKIARNITRQKQTEQKLQAMNETLEERVEERTAALLSYQDQLRSLASELSKAEEHERQRLATDLHDNLGQMLAVGKIKLDLLQRSQLPDRAASGAAELAELMDDAIKYTRELMSDLKPPPSLDKEDLSVSIGWVADKMKKHDLNVTVSDDGQPKPLSEDVRTTLRQCTRELLFNVVKHAGVNKATIQLSRAGDYVQVVVEDKGKGFSLKSKEPTPTEEGGFGLFNIHERMDLLGGNLEVISEPGRGTKMILRVPVEGKDKFDMPSRNEEESNKAESNRPDEAEAKPKIKVLLVDDHKMMREGLRKMIEEEDDLTVIAEASEGKEGIKLARETSPDVVVMDVNMPGMNGIEATQKITADAPQMRVIGLSLQEEKSVVRAMRNAGASAYLTKSEVFETLCATIRSEAAMVKE